MLKAMMMQQQATQGLFLSPTEKKNLRFKAIPLGRNSMVYLKRKKGLTYSGTFPENT